ncbi:MAG: hypothetical protein J5678_05170, partial [Bacteroidaceae bacterium]|nr:hypothetical protein [Bacteroidaceae bacterium]
MAFTYQESVNKGMPLPCTRYEWITLINSRKVRDICKQIAELDENDPDYNEKKQALKKKLPIIIPHAASFKNMKRVSADAVPSGLAMLDVDHVEDPREWFEHMDKRLFVDNQIYLIAITASGKGLRLIGARHSGESIEAAQMRMAEALGIKEYDAVTKDLARASYVVPKEYILWMDETELFAERGWEAEPAEVQSDGGQTPLSNPEGLMSGEELCYRGIPYANIVAELMVQTGNAGGAVQGERNTVYFALANYMRYICDFNADLLLKVLPDFGLSEPERKQAITSAIGRPRKSEVPVIVQSAIVVCEREREVRAGAQTQSQKASDMAMPPLPPLMKILCRRLPEQYRPAMIVASLPVLGTLATRVRFEYLDRQVQSLSFFSCITAPAATGKSFIRKPLDLLLTPINEQDVIEREKEQK